MVNIHWDVLQWSLLPGIDTVCVTPSPACGVPLVTCFLPTEYDNDDGIEFQSGNK